jgi:chromosome segregation ATPase
VASKELAAGFREYPSEYEDEKMDHTVAADMFERADQVGRSRAYYDRLGEVRSVRTFYAEEKEDIRRKVAGAAQHTAQQAGCNAEVGGAAAVTLDKMIDEKLEERLRDRNDAHRLLERHREALGKKNVAALEKQLDDVTLASYLVHIALVEEKVRLRRVIEEAPKVKETADELIEEEHRYQSQDGRTDAEKQAAGERIEAMKTAKGRVDTAVRNAERTLEKMDKRIEQAQKAHREALAKLVEDLRGRKPQS